MLRFLRRPRKPAFDDDTWRAVVASLPFLAGRPAADLEALRALSLDFLARKQVSGAAGFEPDARVRATIAAQACLPVLRLDGGLALYDDFVEVIVYPGGFVAPRRETVAAGDLSITHEWEETLAGEAMDGGPVVLSWEDVDAATHGAGCCVVIHEFAHKLDMADGIADGCPPMPARRRAAWMRTLDAAHAAFDARLADIEASIPAHVDPESEEADAWYADLPFDPYAATDPAEFFAVTSEVFFVDGEALREACPAWHACLAGYYRQEG